MFQSVIPPDSAADEGYHKYPSTTRFQGSDFGFGASTSFTDFFVGTIKNVRYYDRVLTESVGAVSNPTAPTMSAAPGFSQGARFAFCR
jgi:hypothetical protein